MGVASNSANVITLVVVSGRLYAMSRRNGRTCVRFVQRQKRERPTRPGVVVPFPGCR